MKKSERLALYFDLFSLIVDDPWIPPYLITKEMNKTHKPRTASTYTTHLINMYKNQISHTPWIILKPYLGHEIKVFMCKKQNEKELYKTFKDLYEDKRVSYVTLLSDCDFLFMTRNKDIENELNTFNLELIKVSCVYTPIYTVPKGWNLSEKKTLRNFLNYTFDKGLIEREVYRNLGWDNLDWKIYELMRLNIRQKWVRISQKTGVFLSTVKRHFEQKIHPKCITVNKFFPKGLLNYELLILRIKSNYERTLTEAFRELPCTNIIFPLESELILFWYHENTKEILKTLEKIEEIGIIDTYHLFNPIIHGSPD